MDKRKKEEFRTNSYTPSRMDDVLDAGQKMLDDAKNEERPMQSAQLETDEKVEN